MKENENLLDKLAALDTNTISDAMDFLGLVGATPGLLPLWDCPKIVGRTSTIKLGWKLNAKPTQHLISPVIDAVQSNDRVLVVSGGLDGVSCWGDILANAAKLRGIRGTIIDGFSRDIEGSESINYPVFGRGLTMVSARNRIMQIDSACPINVAGVSVDEDDYVIADRCGCVFISQEHITSVIDLAQSIDRRQSKMIEALHHGQMLTDVMHDKQFDAIKDNWSNG